MAPGPKPPRLVQAIAILTAALLGSAVGSTALSEVIVDTATGNVLLRNGSSFDVMIDGYSLDSTSGSLLPGGWTSVADTYDVSGDMSVDDSAEWFELSNSAFSLAEASTTQLSGLLSGFQVVSLGSIWDTVSGEMDLEMTILAGELATPLGVEYRHLAGDYEGDYDVDMDDFDIWVADFGYTNFSSPADGNGDGVVDAADFTVWRDSLAINEQLALSQAASSEEALFGMPAAYLHASPAINVPEPSAVSLLAASSLAALRRRRRN
ncbi:hypothetical protein Mal64_31340 [Pseudobythopirellula maris]|uniref:PEP-CTERM protein-sorting domain-containing protein n=1 Tax=Pseudobythopirellula maris TaxID=2527991 RepID=A0A5C5ZJM5_9BACT|nr:PEP-CTERM sorting domain-containing protein [Pseudobythopirellula maris]TWT87592.1 hypothetical protein Mal64_31340 [Pseudobythopirellula maris]